MAVKRKGAGRSIFLEKVLGRMDRIGAEGLQSVVQRLARERSFLETLFNAIEEGVVVVDAGGKVAYFNAQASRLLGLPDEGVEGEPISRYLPDLEWSRLLATGDDAASAVRRTEFEVQFPRPRYLRLYTAPLDGGTTGGAGLALILHDATEARQRTHEAVESERVHALTLLAASVAHEIGNPLNALHIHLQLIERDARKLRLLSGLASAPATGRRRARATPDTADFGEVLDRVEKYLAVAQGEIGRLDYIVTEFLQALRPTPPRLREGSLNESARATLDLLRPELENRGIVVRDALAKGLPVVRFDPSQVKQVLVNLVKNAMQAMGTGGTLTLSSGAGPDAVWISVADTGCGIPAEQVSRLFEPFHTTKEKGTGLGLLVVQRIVRAHGGRIEVSSQVGQGTTIRFWIPLAEPAPRLLGSPRTTDG